MAIQLDVTTRNAQAAQILASIGASPTLKLWTGAMPANTAAADSGVLLSSQVLPVAWLSSPSSGSVSKLGNWVDPSAAANGNIGYFRIYDSGGTCRMQGTCSLAGGGGDMIVSTLAVVVGAPVTVNSFAITEANS